MFSNPWALTTHYSFRFLVAALAVWRLTHLLTQEDGPWEVLKKARLGLGSGMLGKLASCFYCLSIWVALPFAWFVGGSFVEMAVAWWALSGAAVLLERATRDPFELKVEDNETWDAAEKQRKAG
jgi:hypothetical protein